MKIALDIHGVIDAAPEKFVTLATHLRSFSFDNEVHIITGESISQKLINQLLSYNHGEQFWDHLVSIQDELVHFPSTEVLRINEYGRPVFPEYDWNSFKGRYCKEHKIDLAIDDSPEYAEYFETPFLLYTHNTFNKENIE
jgi:hypothetical protein